MCQFTQPLAIGDIEALDSSIPGYPVGGSLRLDFGGTQITASVWLLLLTRPVLSTLGTPLAMNTLWER